MTYTLYDYRIATGHNVALGSLTVVSSISQFRHVAPISQPVPPFPQRVMLLSGRQVGYGRIDHEWVFPILPPAALDKLIDDYLVTSSAVVASKAVTIYTRLHDRLTYARYNAYLLYPRSGEDYRYENQYIRDLRLKFTDLEAL